MKKWKTRMYRYLYNLFGGPKHQSEYTNARNLHEFKVAAKSYVGDFFMLLVSVLSAGFGLKGFLLPNNFLDGGATGLALLTAELTGIQLPILLVAINLPFFVLGYRLISKQFALKMVCCIIALAACVAFVKYPIITNDRLLISVFGGFFLGTGIGLAVRGGSVLDGTEVLAIALSKKLGMTIGDVIMSVNIIVFSLGAWLVSVETAMYAMLTYLAASKTVDFIIEGIEEYTGVTIISVKSEQIRLMIVEKLGRGITVYNGERGFGKSGERLYDLKIIYTIITRLEVSKLKLELEKIDPNAFVVMSSVKDMKGGMIKKRRLSED